MLSLDTQNLSFIFTVLPVDSDSNLTVTKLIKYSSKTVVKISNYWYTIEDKIYLKEDKKRKRTKKNKKKKY